MRPNILLITADDMNYDAVGAFGAAVADVTPSIDRLAADGLRFQHGHVTIAVCQPSRSALMTGRYPHRSGGEGFHRLRRPDVPILPQLLRDGGYQVGILGKLGHSTPHEDFRWDMAYDMPALGQGRNPQLYGDHAQDFIAASLAADKPFFLMANSHDPHRPFYGNDFLAWYEGETPAQAPSRVFSPEEIAVPAFLHDLPEVRLEIAEYLSSCRRCDDTVGRLLAALDATGASDNTLVMFLSDNGMAFPFAKTNCYLNSTHTPWIVRWPAILPPSGLDEQHMINGIDYLPTILEATGIPCPPGVDGTSFLSVLHGEPQPGRDRLFTQFHQTAGKRNYPMRAIHTRRFGYLWNPWSDGERVFRNESQAGRTFAAMQAATDQDPELAARVELFLYRVPEELYDFAADPNALNNLVDDPAYADDLAMLKRELEAWMVATEDPALSCFQAGSTPEAREALFESQVAELGGS